MYDPTMLVYDFEEHAHHFKNTFARSLRVVEELHRALLNLLSEPKCNDQADNIVYLLAAECLREFTEIRLLATGELGMGAAKLSRALYERVVTLSYLAKHPEEIQQFMDYSDVHWHKLLVEAREAFGDDEASMAQVVSKKEAEAIEDKFKRAKSFFQQSDCGRCKTKRLQGSWTKKSTAQLATAVSKEVRRLYFKGFLGPTLYIHTTFYGIVHQYTTSAEGRLVFNEAHQQESARDTMSLAHILLLQAFDVVNTYFNLGKDEVLKELAFSGLSAWNEVSESTPAPG